MRPGEDDAAREAAARACFGALALGIVAWIAWRGVREGRPGFALSALAVSLLPGAVGVTVAAGWAHHRGRALSGLGLAVGAFVPPTIAFAAALWVTGEPTHLVVSKSLSAGGMILTTIAGAWFAVRGFPESGEPPDPP